MIFFDIETATPAYDSLDDGTKEQWESFCLRRLPDEPATKDCDWPRLWDDKAALYPEFALVCCISYAIGDGEVKSITLQGSEIEVLERFSKGLQKNAYHWLCAHNGKGFDYPFLGRRMLIKQVDLPPQLRIAGKKPWDLKLEDTAELWQFAQRGPSTSLDLICHCLGIKSPKDSISGRDVPRLWRAGRIEEISDYCKKDVYALREVYNILKNAKAE